MTVLNIELDEVAYSKEGAIQSLTYFISLG